MSGFILIGLSLLAGMALRRFRMMPDNGPEALNSFIIHISLPALTVYHIHKLDASWDLLLPVVSAWIVFVGGFVFFWALSRLFGHDKGIFGALVLSCGLGNTSFVGFPLIESLYGREAVGIAVVFDQPGTFTVLSTLGIAVAAWLSTGQVSAREIGKRIFTFPPFLAFLAALATRGIEFPAAINEVLLPLGNTLTPLALVSVGLQLKFSDVRENWKLAFAGLGYKLFLAPVMIYIFALSFPDGLVRKVSVLEAGMAPMITGGIVAIRYGFHPALVSTLIGVGIPVSFITVYFWYLVAG